ncbi:MAG: ribose 5-phosphate isomerase B [Candidatus Omnitrophica bacterium]|nr:ribose 5-phosphate isomerase B [Candidatus Omnitrophota bacterium]
MTGIRYQKKISRHSKVSDTGPVRVAVGADHGGFQLKAKLVALLRARGLEVADLGTHSAAPCDYPAIGGRVAAAVAQGAFDRGILLCKSGIGIAIAANKVPGIRAAVCHDPFDAERSRSHNDANILVLGAEKLSEARARRITEVWLATPFESGGRHERRVKQIAALEKKYRVLPKAGKVPGTLKGGA